MDKPELVIGYDRDSKPVSAVCSLCRARMPEESPKLSRSADRLIAYSAQFVIHIRTNHSSPTAK
jgi:hypothetical protein